MLRRHSHPTKLTSPQPAARKCTTVDALRQMLAFVPITPSEPDIPEDYHFIATLSATGSFQCRGCRCKPHRRHSSAFLRVAAADSDHVRTLRGHSLLLDRLLCILPTHLQNPSCLHHPRRPVMMAPKSLRDRAMRRYTKRLAQMPILNPSCHLVLALPRSTHDPALPAADEKCAAINRCLVPTVEGL